ncbi:hypothetical protein [Rhodoferax sp. GW822-FHT02A01]|uniref:hypothetical protein n=1 Tax=Rhodoferax sp. GW822-FHT02A01 TaxID=3141537 RepID=UPI00315C9AC8
MNFMTMMLLASSLGTVGSAEALTICAGNSCGPAVEAPPVLSVGGTAPVALAQPIGPVSPFFVELIPFQDFSGWHYDFEGEGGGVTTMEAPFYGGWSPIQDSIPNSPVPVLALNAGVSDFSVLWTDKNGLSRAGASFISAFAPAIANLTMTKDDGTAFNIVLYIPFTPAAEAAGYLPVIAASVPEPSIAMMGLLGLLVISYILVVGRQDSVPGISSSIEGSHSDEGPVFLLTRS